MKIIKFVHTSVIMFALGTAGCTTMASGQKMDVAQVETIKDRVTTRVQVEKMMGRPAESDMWDSQTGTRALTWTYNSIKVDGTTFIPFVGELLGKSHETNQQLVVFVDKKGIVRSHTFTNSANQNKSALETMQGR